MSFSIQKHIEEEYSVVGILEDLSQTLSLLESYIPGINKLKKNIIMRHKKKLNRYKKNIWYGYATLTTTSVLVLWIHKGYHVVQKVVWNVCIKAF